MTKVSGSDVSKIKAYLRDGHGVVEVARAFWLHVNTVSQINRGLTHTRVKTARSVPSLDRVRERLAEQLDPLYHLKGRAGVAACGFTPSAPDHLEDRIGLGVRLLTGRAAGEPPQICPKCRRAASRQAKRLPERSTAQLDATTGEAVEGPGASVRVRELRDSDTGHDTLQLLQDDVTGRP